MKAIQAPNELPAWALFGPTTVFLAGSIDMGIAEDWQTRLCETLGKKYTDEQLTLFNPRRDDFDTSQEQSINNEYFSNQVNWELDGLDLADYVFMYFDPNSKSPITLLELGIYTDTICKLIVVCPDGFYRQGNVEIVCERHGIPFFRNIENGLDQICSYIDTDQKITSPNDEEDEDGICY